MPDLRILSIGWGVQSWTLAAMCAKGLIEPPDYILHADTTWEHAATYNFAKEWTPWLEEHGMQVITGSDKKAANVVWDDTGQTHVPLFTVNHDTGKRGMLRRSCTNRWKMVPQKRVLTKLLKERGIKKTPGAVEQMIGISMDEWSRIKTSDVKYITLSFPLVDMKITRQQCIDWLLENDLPVPPKSSCVICPYHSDSAWRKLKDSEDKEDWELAVKADKAIRSKRPGHDCFLSSQRVPLTELDLPDKLLDRDFDLSGMPCDSGHCFL